MNQRNGPQLPPEEEFDWNTTLHRTPRKKNPTTNTPSPRHKRIARTTTGTTPPLPPKPESSIPPTSAHFPRSRFRSVSASFSNRVTSILHKEPTQRSSNDRAFLLIFCQRCRLFDHLDPNEIKILLTQADLVEFYSGDRIYSANDDCGKDCPASHTYLIIEGTVSICAQNDNHTVDTTSLSEYIAQTDAYIVPVSQSLLHKGEYIMGNLGSTSHFGRFAASHPTRFVSVISSSTTQCMRIPASAFQHAIIHHRNVHKEDVLKAIQSAHCFASLTLPQIKRVALHAKLKTYTRNQIVFQQSYPVTGVAIVKSGSFRILQKRGNDCLIEVGVLGVGEAWGYKSLLRVPKNTGYKQGHLKKNPQKTTRAKKLWNKLSSAVQCIYHTSLISHQRETTCELVWISASEWKVICTQNPQFKANLTFSVMFDHKKSSMEDKDVENELGTTQALEDEASQHIATHAAEYRTRSDTSTKRDSMWWRQEDASERMEAHVLEISQRSRRASGLPAVPHWLKNKMITGTGNRSPARAPRQGDLKREID